MDQIKPPAPLVKAPAAYGFHTMSTLIPSVAFAHVSWHQRSKPHARNFTGRTNEEGHLLA